MSLEDSIRKIKTGKAKEVDRAKKELKRAFNKDSKKETAFRTVVGGLDDYDRIDGEKNKIAFIYGLRLAAKNRGRSYFPLFTDFIIDNIQSDSGNVREAVIRLTETLINSMLSDSQDLTKREKDVFTDFIDEILILLEAHYDSEYEKYERVSDIPACKYKSLEKLLSKIINPASQESLQRDRKVGMPKWMDCTWKRVPCMEEDCPVCNKLKELEKENSLFHREEFLMDVVGEEEVSEKALPEPDDFPFYIKVREWLETVITIADESKETGDFWIFTEEATDLFWYMNVLSAKTYRQLCNRYLIEGGEKDGSVDYEYTKYILVESTKIIKKSIKEILKSEPTHKADLKESFDRLMDLEEKLFNI